MGREVAKAVQPLHIGWVMVPFFYCSPVSSTKHFWGFLIPVPSGCFLTSSSSLPGFVSPPVSMFQHAVPPSPCVYLETHVPGYSIEGCGPDRLSCLPRPAISLSSNSSRCSSAQLISPVGKVPLDVGTSVFFRSLKPKGRSHPTLFSFFPFFFLLSYLVIRDLFCTLQCPRSSDNLQLVLCENLPSVDVFLMHLWRESPDVLLLLPSFLLPPSNLLFFILFVLPWEAESESEVAS